MSGRILLIDDDDSLRRVTEYNLVAAGFEVVTAASGKEGLEGFTEYDPDLVVTDVELGDMNGLELMAEFKKKNRPKDAAPLLNKAEAILLPLLPVTSDRGIAYHQAPDGEGPPDARPVANGRLHRRSLRRDGRQAQPGAAQALDPDPRL